LVVERVIDHAAKAAAIDITDERLTMALRARRDSAGGPKGYFELLARLGRSVEEDRREVRRALEAEEFVARCLGESPDAKLVRPELARLLQTTTKEVQDAWREHKDRFVKPGKVEVALAVVRNDAHPDPGAARAALAEALRSNPPSRLEVGNGDPSAPPLPGLTVARKSLDTAAVDALLPALRETARSGAPGTVSVIAESDAASLAIEVISREPDQKLEFEAASELIREWLRVRKRDLAVRKLVASLLAETAIWPADLFAAPAPDSTVAPRGDAP
jgi:HPt (histidine-containing phosphotransfer) domain-containing protein